MRLSEEYVETPGAFLQGKAHEDPGTHETLQEIGGMGHPEISSDANSEEMQILDAEGTAPAGATGC
jgi:hypothetical protein